jgi:hypothetical protein
MGVAENSASACNQPFGGGEGGRKADVSRAEPCLLQRCPVRLWFSLCAVAPLLRVLDGVPSGAACTGNRSCSSGRRPLGHRQASDPLDATAACWIAGRSSRTPASRCCSSWRTTIATPLGITVRATPWRASTWFRRGADGHRYRVGGPRRQRRLLSLDPPSPDKVRRQEGS